MKFPTPQGTGVVIGQQRALRECYEMAMKEPKVVCLINIVQKETPLCDLVSALEKDVQPEVAKVQVFGPLEAAPEPC